MTQPPLSCIYCSGHIKTNYHNPAYLPKQFFLSLHWNLWLWRWSVKGCVTCNRSGVTLSLLRLIITLVIAYNVQSASATVTSDKSHRLAWLHHLSNWNKSLAATINIISEREGIRDDSWLLLQCDMLTDETLFEAVVLVFCVPVYCLSGNSTC